MCRFLGLVILVFISSSGYSQFEKNKISFIDSLGNEINSNESYFVFKFNNKADSIKLDHLYDDDYTRTIASNYILDFSVSSIHQDSSVYSVTCSKEEIMIVDSIDINQDGIKELFLHRKWDCSASPPVPRAYGVGVHWQKYSQYEVWDIHSKKRIFEVKNVSKGGVAISTNVGRSYGYSFKVEIDKKGSFFLSEFSEKEGEFEMGKYVYNSESKEYRKN